MSENNKQVNNGVQLKPLKVDDIHGATEPSLAEVFDAIVEGLQPNTAIGDASAGSL